MFEESDWDPEAELAGEEEAWGPHTQQQPPPANLLLLECRRPLALRSASKCSASLGVGVLLLLESRGCLPPCLIGCLGFLS